jgi:predicted TPR repeat methyltransferase
LSAQTICLSKQVITLNGSEAIEETDLGATPADVELTVPELVAFAMRLHRDKRLDAAEKCYRGVLQADAENATSLHYLGVLLHQRGRGGEGFDLIQKSIAIDPNVAPWYNNLGNVLLDEARFDEAAIAYARCTELDESNLEVLNNLGVLLRKLKRTKEAENSFNRAVLRDPTFRAAHANLATLCTLEGRMPEAFSHFANALALQPADPNTRRLLVHALGKAGRFFEGQKICREWLASEPDDPMARHFLAAYGGAEIPERASDGFVIDEFDGFANSFDAKLASLEYRAPQWVGDAVASLYGKAAKDLRILDAGCGTGLCAPFLLPFAKELVGVDLSANMLSRAFDRHLYDGLAQSELVAYALACGTTFDAVVSADTLCYFGKLTAAFSAIEAALRPGGRWVFTVEAHTLDQSYRLQPHGRYSHSKAYVENELTLAGFGSIVLKQVDLRYEGGEPVSGWLVTARKPDKLVDPELG